MDTIFAPATAPGKAGVAVVRISGPIARVAAEKMVGNLPSKGRTLRQVRASTGEILDEALVLTFPHGASFTGEDVVELQCHGSPVAVEAICRELATHNGLRPAEAGEFTRRAFENGVLDLMQVEGLADLLDAETETQRRMALRSYSGEASAAFDLWRTKLLRALALVEATIDFADEDVPVDVGPEVDVLLCEVKLSMEEQLRGASAAEIVRDGFQVAIVGLPNSGKSTLINKLAGRDVAITSDLAGTTRDVIEVHLDLAGIPVTVLDTAGLRDAEDDIEAIGVARAKERAAAADLRIHLLSDQNEDPTDIFKPGDIVALGKADLRDQPGGLSGLTGQGVETLVEDIRSLLMSRSSDASFLSRERQRVAVEQAVFHLSTALEVLDDLLESPDLIAEELRLSVRSVEGLVGRVDVEQVLGEIFSSFCIGK